MKTSNHSNWILIACVCAVSISVLWKSDQSDSGTFQSINAQDLMSEQPAPVQLSQSEVEVTSSPHTNSPVIVNQFASGPLVSERVESITTPISTPTKAEAPKLPVMPVDRNQSQLAKSDTQPKKSGKSIYLPAITFEKAETKTSPSAQRQMSDPSSTSVSAAVPHRALSQDTFMPTSTPVPAPREQMRNPEVSSIEPPATNVIPISGAMLMTKLERGESLARRGAWATAQKEFVDVLYMMAQQADLKEGGNITSRRLRDALLALDEAQDFMADSGPSALDVSSIIARHQSKILKSENSQDLTNFAAAQAYYSAARVMFHDTFYKNKLASRAFYSLGKLHSITSVNGNDEATQSARAMLFHYAALDCDDRNYPAANELGVMLAKSGRLEEARDVLNHCVNVQPTLSSLQSLARVNKALGEEEAAR
ncbi:MAG: tetratricopeptide repeat protein, partial [Pirellulaceae bacterium]